MNVRKLDKTLRNFNARKNSFNSTELISILNLLDFDIRYDGAHLVAQSDKLARAKNTSFPNGTITFGCHRTSKVLSPRAYADLKKALKDLKVMD